ncbi:SURF1 family protein [Candidatus Pandoraea novymonadis]|uniref:SURF1-like protein n=1 Tax=Candidatus Pandoraea novymonadis TaxID=1808959 RepID=A0ABX5FD16_9BURK|nr:SURF1 family protein [Candidatus Pandoraea novymonadis]PSB91683.1 hypothetical protein BZL35_00901 [Candidatus Pandoraea novymonadis]
MCPVFNAEVSSRKSRATFAFMFFVVIVLLVFFVLVGLGTWQIYRRTWKLDLIERVEARVYATPVTSPSSWQWPQINRANDEYRHVSLRGTYLYDKETFVQAVTEFGSGFWVITPFLQEDDGNIVLVNRGFVPPKWRKQHLVYRGQSDIKNVTGLLRISEPVGSFLQKNDALTDSWYSRDVPAIAESRGLNRSQVAPFFIDADATSPDSNDRPVFPIGGLTVISFTNNHLVYSITWYLLAGMVVSVSYFVGRMEIWQRCVSIK